MKPHIDCASRQLRISVGLVSPARGQAVNEPKPVSDKDRRISHPVFASCATSDRKQALSACKAIESRGTPCWISSRDVAPGENYQEAIVRPIRMPGAYARPGSFPSASVRIRGRLAK